MKTIHMVSSRLFNGGGQMAPLCFFNTDEEADEFLNILVNTMNRDGRKIHSNLNNEHFPLFDDIQEAKEYYKL